MIKNKKYWDYKNTKQLLDLYDLEIIVNRDGTLSAKDKHPDCYFDHHNNKLEYENFKELVDRLDIYHHDILVCYLCDMYDLCEDDFDDWKSIHEWLSYHYLETAYNCEVPYDEIDLLGLVCNGE